MPVHIICDKYLLNPQVMCAVFDALPVIFVSRVGNQLFETTKEKMERIRAEPDQLPIKSSRQYVGNAGSLIFPRLCKTFSPLQMAPEVCIILNYDQPQFGLSCFSFLVQTHCPGLQGSTDFIRLMLSGYRLLFF